MLAQRELDPICVVDLAPRAAGGPPEVQAAPRRRRRRWRARSPLEVLTLGETAQSERLALRRGVADARDAVAVLRDELASLAQANAEPACALLRERFSYAAQLRRELVLAEARLQELRSRRQDLLLELRGLRSAAARLGRRERFPPP